MPGSEPYSAQNGPLGVLVLHGFTGNPFTMRSLAEAVASDGYSVELPRLPGHGTSIEDLMRFDWSDWSGAAIAAYDDLASRCERVALVGLSMGGGLSAYIAEHRPEVAGCVFINPFDRPLPPDLLEGLNALIDSGVEAMDGNGSDIKKEGPLEYSAAYVEMPLVGVRSVSEGIAKVNADLGAITAPCLLLTSREDHTVSWERGEDIVECVTGPVEQVWLEDSYHVATLDNDAQKIESLTLAFLAKVLR
jgi:carboxylesterase